jgi:hypothetical protein
MRCISGRNRGSVRSGGAGAGHELLQYRVDAAAVPRRGPCGHQISVSASAFAAAGLITVAGLSLHAFGMWDKHRLEAVGQAENPLGGVALY